jgi:sigma-B regulation protein RsbU (phosphoserine phosphatase)
MRYTNAGHPKPLHIRRSAGRVAALANLADKSQPALGLFEQAAYQTTEVKLERNDLIMLFTDGLYEVQDKKSELYSQSLLVTDVQRRLKLPASDLFNQILKQISEFSADGKFTDDVCLVGMEFTGNVGAATGGTASEGTPSI